MKIYSCKIEMYRNIVIHIKYWISVSVAKQAIIKAGFSVYYALKLLQYFVKCLLFLDSYFVVLTEKKIIVAIFRNKLLCFIDLYLTILLRQGLTM